MKPLHKCSCDLVRQVEISGSNKKILLEGLLKKMSKISIFVVFNLKKKIHRKISCSQGQTNS
jgi:hypothetical protein